MLGISERAVRKRIETNQLLAVKEDHAWVVLLDPGTTPLAESVPPLTPSGTASPVKADTTNTAAPWWGEAVRETFDESAEGQAVSDAVPVPPVDLTPLINLVADLTRRNAELTEAATIWQIRAHDLDQRLKQLGTGVDEAGDDQRQDAPERAPKPPRRDERAPEGDPTSSWLATVLRRLRGG